MKRHRVKSYTRQGRRVRSYMRGRGGTSRPVKPKTITKTTATQEQIEAWADKWEYGQSSMLFQNQANRNAVWKELKRRGHKDLKRRSDRNQQLHPQYVADWEGELDTGFGNVQYRTWFDSLYHITRPYRGGGGW